MLISAVLLVVLAILIGTYQLVNDIRAQR